MTGFGVGVVEGRAVLVKGERVRDIAAGSDYRFGSDPMALFSAWHTFSQWAQEQRLDETDPVLDLMQMELCVPRPANIFGIGVNYHDHIAEAGMDVPAKPMVFAKFSSCLIHGTGTIPLTSNRVDWEAELVVVVGQGGRNIKEQDWQSAVAGFCVGQDISDRRQQFSDKPPQFSIAKSADGYGPIGPYVASLDEFENPQDLAISCSINGERMQTSSTSRMIFSVPELIAFISQWCQLRPGDLIFTGTPGGTGGLQDPRRYLAPGDVITTSIEGIGSIRNVCVDIPRQL